MNLPSEQNTDTELSRPGDQPSEAAHEPAYSIWQRLESSLGPVLAGLLIDIIDLSTFGPFGIFSGMLLGGSMALWICSIYGIPRKQRWFWALLAGVYCTIPMTEFIPIATLAGAYARYRRPPLSTENEECAEDTP